MPESLNKTTDVYRHVTPEERDKVRAVREHVKEHLPELLAKGRAAKMRYDALKAALGLLKQTRQAKGISLSELARRTGIDKSRLSKLENDPDSNPTLDTLTRLADGLEVSVSLVVADKKAA